MKIVKILAIGIIALLSIAAGLAKAMQAPQEMEFLQALGLSPGLIISFGVAQIVGGLLLIAKKTRMYGAVLVALAFAMSAVLVFMSGNLVFGLVSVIPAALAGLIVYWSSRDG